MDTVEQHHDRTIALHTKSLHCWTVVSLPATVWRCVKLLRSQHGILDKQWSYCDSIDYRISISPLRNSKPLQMANVQPALPGDIPQMAVLRVTAGATTTHSYRWDSVLPRHLGGSWHRSVTLRTSRELVRPFSPWFDMWLYLLRPSLRIDLHLVCRFSSAMSTTFTPHWCLCKSILFYPIRIEAPVLPRYFGTLTISFEVIVRSVDVSILDLWTLLVLTFGRL